FPRGGCRSVFLRSPFAGVDYTNELRSPAVLNSAGASAMQLEDMIIVSVDDHIVEPPTVFDQHLPRKYKDKAPKCTKNDKGEDIWLFEGLPTVNFALNAVAGRPREEL